MTTPNQTEADQARKWAVMDDAERRNEAVSRDPTQSHAAREAAAREAQAARQQWSDAADRVVAQRQAA